MLFIIDAGHAPQTPGKRSPKLEDGRQLLEWRFTRAIARALCERLSRIGIANHELTPHVEEDIAPSSRASMANDIDTRVAVDTVLVSIHANAHGNGAEFNDAHGVTVLHYPGSKRSAAIAQVFQDSIVAATGWHDRGIKGRGDLSILKHTHMPAVLTENGFYTHREQCEQLLTAETCDAIVQAHVDAILSVASNA